VVRTYSSLSRYFAVRQSRERLNVSNDSRGENPWQGARSFIGRLLRVSCPTTIQSVVSFVSILALQCFSSWPNPHVGEKVLKNAPASTNANATSTEARIIGGSRIRCARNHSSPTVVCPRRFLPGVAVRCDTLADMHFVFFGERLHASAILQEGLGYGN